MSFSPEELLLFEEIESRRNWIIDQNRLLHYRDFGAGNPEESRTPEVMYAGVEVYSSTDKNCRIGLKGEWARWIYAQVKYHRPRTVLELGTNCGFSSIYMAKASPSSQIYTIDGAKAVAEVAGENIQALGCKNIIQHIGRFQDILETILASIKIVDFAFIDGHHDGESTIDYFAQIKPYLSSGAVVVFDDIHWSKGMEQGWDRITTDSIIESFEDKGKLGVVYCR